VPDRRVAAAAALLVLAVAGCADGRSDEPTTGAGTEGGTTSGTGASTAYELVATDDLSVSPDGDEVLADCWNGICRWDATDGALELLPDRGTVAVAPDWSTVATVDDGTVVLEDLDSGEAVTELSGLADAGTADGSSVTAVSYSPDGSRVAAAGLSDDGGVVMVWSVDGSEQATFETGSEVHALAFAPDGDRIATAGNGPVEVHDLEGGGAEVLDSGKGGTVAWSSDGALLLGPGASGQPVVWGTDEWDQVDELAVPDLHEAAFAPDSSTVAVTTLRATTVALWDIAGESAVHLGAHTSPPGAVAWSPDGSVLYSVSADDGVLAWEEDRDRVGVDFELPEGR
jgi:WD40 repeat protein